MTCKRHTMSDTKACTANGRRICGPFRFHLMRHVQSARPLGPGIKASPRGSPDAWKVSKSVLMVVMLCSYHVISCHIINELKRKVCKLECICGRMCLLHTLCMCTYTVYSNLIMKNTRVTSEVLGQNPKAIGLRQGLNQLALQ